MTTYLMITLLLLSCAVSGTGYGQIVTLPDIDISDSPNGIVYLPENIPSIFTKTFSKYTKVIAPNGKPIHFLAQDGWTDDQIVKARNVLEFILTDFPGSEYGSNKTAVANAMAERKAAMVLFNTPKELGKALRGLSNKTNLSMQDLRANECPWEGSNDYMRHITRDAAYEEILHLVYDYGIKKVLPEMVAEIQRANDTATELGSRENNPDEYAAVLLDIYLDLWCVNPQKYEGYRYPDGVPYFRNGPPEVPEGWTHFGRYFANSRAKMKELDPVGYKLIEKFFHPYLTYTPQLPVDFKGTFSLECDESRAYTHKSQHLKNVTLRGSNDAHIIGNGYDNVLTGNSGNNILRGSGGDDRLNGNKGDDTAVFSGDYADYSVTHNEGFVTVSDKRMNRDGTDTLTNIEFIQFSNRKVKL